MPPMNIYMCDGQLVEAYTMQGATNEFTRLHGHQPRNVSPYYLQPSYIDLMNRTRPIGRHRKP